MSGKLFEITVVYCFAVVSQVGVTSSAADVVSFKLSIWRRSAAVVAPLLKLRLMLKLRLKLMSKMQLNLMLKLRLKLMLKLTLNLRLKLKLRLNLRFKVEALRDKASWLTGGSSDGHRTHGQRQVLFALQSYSDRPNCVFMKHPSGAVVYKIQQFLALRRHYRTPDFVVR